MEYACSNKAKCDILSRKALPSPLTVSTSLFVSMLVVTSTSTFRGEAKGRQEISLVWQKVKNSYAENVNFGQI